MIRIILIIATNPVRYCAKLPDILSDEDCILRKTYVGPPYHEFYVFECYCTSEECNNFDKPPCNSVAGYCDDENI